MLDQLLSLIQEQSEEAIVRNPAVPNQNNAEVMQTLLGAITGGLKQEAESGNVNGIISLLSGKSGQGNALLQNPIVAGIAKNAIGAIVEKFGLNSGTAGQIVTSVLPGVIGSLISKVSNQSDNSFDFNSILGSLLGGGSPGSSSGGFDFNQIGYALADGKLDMNDLVRIGGSLLGNNSGDKQTPQNNTQGGLDLGGLLGGLGSLLGKK